MDESYHCTYPDGSKMPFMASKVDPEDGFCPKCGYLVLGTQKAETLKEAAMCSDCADDLIAWWQALDVLYDDELEWDDGDYDYLDDMDY